MLLSEIVASEGMLPKGAGGEVVAGLTADSRKVAPGALFFALAGTRADGAQFIADAVKRGAVAVVVGEGQPVLDVAVPVIRVAEPRRVLALAAARFYRDQPGTIVAVTGTSGKTSVAEFTRQIFAAAGHASASLGTIGVVKPSGTAYGSLTTPDPVTLHATLAELAHEGVTHLAMEASSHGLDQHRLDGVKLTAAAFTNLGRDHMDYHPTVEHYLAAKMRLFADLLQPGQTAVVNTDGAFSNDVLFASRKAGRGLLTVGKKGQDVQLLEVHRKGFRQELLVRIASGVCVVDFPLIGAYQIENALTACGLAIAAGVSAETAVRALSRLQGVPGRLDIVGEKRGGLAVVDYAHKPEALAAAIEAVRPFVTGKLTCVFGCGGDRDKGKRPIMGAIAAEKADAVIVTDDNPRTEVPAAIRAEILAGVPPQLKEKLREIGDRAEAIAVAMAAIGKGDVVLVAGKGHETGQIVADTAGGGSATKVVPFSDHAEIARALAGAE